MRVPPNLKYFLLFTLVIGAIVAGTIYLPRIIPGIGRVLMWVLIGGMVVLMLFTFIKPFFTFLYARADGILEVFIDQNNKGFHVFAYHLNSGGESFSAGTRDIQQYYIVADTGKLYYKQVYSHTMEPMSGRSGWGGYTSFEESVLPSPMFDKSMAKLSGKAGTTLQLGKKVQPTDDNHYSFSININTIELKKYEGLVDEGVVIICKDARSGVVQWKRKI